LPQLEALQRNAAIRLTTLSGQPPAQVDHQLLACRKPLQLGTPLPVGDGRTLLMRRPDIRQAERRLAAATARIGVNTAALYPDIKLGASVGSTGGASDLFSPLTNRFAAGPMVSWNLHQSAVRARIAQAEAQTQANLASFDATVLRALREVESTLNTYNAALTRRADLLRSSRAATQVATRTKELRDGGKVGGIAALEAQRGSLAAEQALAAVEAEVNSNQIAVFLALGGGWT
jgi:outer membrane protein TolC